MKSLLSLVLVVACGVAVGEPEAGGDQAAMVAKEGAVKEKAANAIDELVTRLAKDGFWKNGTYPSVEIPKSATPEEVIRAYCEKDVFTSRTLAREIQVVESRALRIGEPPGNQYRAVHCETDAGPCIFLM